MELTGKEILNAFKDQHPDARSQTEAWEVEVGSADWKTPHDLKKRYSKASLPGKQNVVFDICWNKYRIWVKVAYNVGVVIVKAAGTHKEYEKWNIQ
jgi:mRNA interferase HigB